jgi:hypothetical protein
VVLNTAVNEMSVKRDLIKSPFSSFTCHRYMDATSRSLAVCRVENVAFPKRTSTLATPMKLSELTVFRESVKM